MKRMMISWGIALMLFLAACQSSPAEEPLSPTQNEPYPSPEEVDGLATPVGKKTDSREAYPGPDSKKEALPEGATIVFRRSGGFAGVDEEWTIYSDGRITSTDGGAWRVTPDQVEPLAEQIDKSGFFELDGKYLPLDTCCDRFTYQVSVNMGDKANSVTTIDAAPGVPPELWEIIGELNTLLTSLEGDQ